MWWRGFSPEDSLLLKNLATLSLMLSAGRCWCAFWRDVHDVWRYEPYEYVSKGTIETIEMNRFSRKPMDTWESWDHIHRSGFLKVWIEFETPRHHPDKAGSRLRARLDKGRSSGWFLEGFSKTCFEVHFFLKMVVIWHVVRLQILSMWQVLDEKDRSEATARFQEGRRIRQSRQSCETLQGIGEALNWSLLIWPLRCRFLSWWESVSQRTKLSKTFSASFLLDSKWLCRYAWLLANR